jgi:thymidylate synthase (FAD)
MNRHRTHHEVPDDQTAFFVDGPRVFVLARPSLADTIDEFYAYFDAKLEKARAVMVYPAEKIVENAGRVCYLSFANPATKTTETYVKNLIQHGHESVLEHVAWTLILTGVSRAFSHQLVRHRVGFAYSQLSQQYVDHRSIRFVIPAEILSDPTLLPRWQEVVLAQRAQYADLMDTLSQLPSNYSAREQTRSRRSAARSILPNCIEAIIAVTANARAWRHFLTVRGSIVGDIEMRRVSAEILTTLKKDAPNLFFDFELGTFDDGWPIVTRVEAKGDGSGTSSRNDG